MKCLAVSQARSAGCVVGVLSTVSLGERAQAAGVLKETSFIAYFEIAQAGLGLFSCLRLPSVGLINIVHRRPGFCDFHVMR